MQLIVNIENEKIADKIIKILESFKEDGVKIIKNEKWDDDYIKKHWRDIIMNTHSADLDDDERLYEAAARFYNEKYSN
jgi:hypothetical protein